MTLSGIDISEVTNALGVIRATVGDTAAIIAPATAGDKNSAAAFSRGTAVASNFGAGPLVELASYVIGKPAVCVRSNATTDGGYGSIDLSGLDAGSTCVPAVDATTHPIDEYDLRIDVVHGGTVGASSEITYKASLDDGRSYFATTALGSATSIALAAYGIAITVASGTLTAGDVIRVRTTPPTEAVGDLQAAEAALRATSLAWDFVVLATPVDSTLFGELSTWLTSLHDTDGKDRAAIVSFRGPAVGESEATYLAAAAAFRALCNDPRILVCFGYCVTGSKVSPGPQLRRPVAFPIARRAAAIKRPSRTDLGQVAGVDGGPLPSDVKLYGSDGNPVRDSDGEIACHDEAQNPGADDLHFCTLRTREGYSGVFVEKPWVFAADGSDIFLWQHRSLVNKVSRAVRTALTARLRSPVLVNATTGFILESEALDIENAVDAAVRAVVAAGPDVSAHKFTLHRDDPLLSTDAPVLNGDERIVPLAYPNRFGVTIGFVNPATGSVA